MGFATSYLLCLFFAIAKPSVRAQTCPVACEERLDVEEKFLSVVEVLQDRMGNIEKDQAELTKKMKRHTKRLRKLEDKVEESLTTSTGRIQTEHGSWASWSDWSPCVPVCQSPVSNSTGRQTRKRSCVREICSGSSTESRTCVAKCTHTDKAPDEEWGDWSSWSQCRSNCRGIIYSRIGRQIRKRKCKLSICRGHPTQSRVCIAKCPKDEGGRIDSRCFQICFVEHSFHAEEDLPQKQCQVKRNNTCFMVLDSRRGLPKNHHENVCLKFNGHLANIYDQQHFGELNEYILSRNFSSSFFWTGMKYTSEKALVFHDGMKSPFAQWIKSNPVPHGLWSAVLFRSKGQKPNDFKANVLLGSLSTSNIPTEAGLKNTNPSSRYQYSLCEFPR